MNIQELTSQDISNWNAFVNGCEHGSIYHLAEWRSLLENVFGHQTMYHFTTSENGAISGVLPAVRLKSFLFGDFIVSMPYFNYGNALGDNAEIEEKLMLHLCEKAETLGVEHIEFRDTRERPGSFDTRKDKVAMVLDIPGSEDEMWKSMGSKLRSQIKRPLREHPAVKHGTMELLDAFYSVFAINMRDLGTPVYSKQFFAKIIETFPDNCHLISISVDDSPVAAAFLLGYGQMLEIPWASSLRKVNSMSINMLLYWEVLKYAINNDYHKFDFGRSTVDSGTYRFKKQWGAVPRQLYWHYWLKEGHTRPHLSPDNSKYKTAINIWRKLPLSITNTIGPGIVKYLP